MSDDDKLLNDLIEGITWLGVAFEKNNLDAPLTIGISRRAHDRLKMLRPSHAVYDPELKYMSIRICGVRFEPTA